MRIDLERSRFVVPPGFRDITNYSFKEGTGQPRERLTVMYDVPPPEGKTLDALMASRKERLEVAGEGMVKVEGVAPTTLAGIEARQTSYTLQDKGEKYRERLAVALLSPSLYVQLTYAASVTDPKAEERFDHIKESAAVAGRPAKGVAGPAKGFVRRSAGQMTLDVPANLRPPRMYQFVSADERIRLTISENAGKRGPTPADPVENLRTRTADGSQLGELRTSDIAAGSARGKLVASILTDSEGKRSAVQQGLLVLDEDLTVQFGGQAPVERAKELEAAINALQSSITK